MTDVLPSPTMPRGGAREGAGRRSAFGHGAVLVRRSVRLPAEVWAELEARAKAADDTTDDGVIARLLGFDRLVVPMPRKKRTTPTPPAPSVGEKEEP